MGKTVAAPTSADDPMLLVLVLVVLTLLIGFGLSQLKSRKYHTRNPYQRFAKPSTFSSFTPLPLAPLNPVLSHDQLDAVSAVSFETQPLLNKSGSRLLPLLESLTRAHGNGHRLMAQVSLGEILRPKPNSAPHHMLDAAYRSINSKRLDFAIFDRFGHLAAAIEYQGHGHHIHDRTFLRDAVKREALRKAGVPYVEVPADFTPEGVTQQIRTALTSPRRQT